LTKKQFNSSFNLNGRGKRYLRKLLVVILVFTACIFFQLAISYGIDGNKGRVEDRIVILGEEDNNKEITIAHGVTIHIELEGTGAAGYKWHIDKLDPGYLELLSEETKPVTGGKIGAPVITYWKIIALKKGSSEILMHYYRPWEGQDKALRHYRVKINVI
jgi:predicted secreted protein